jgi:hypothetical protein
MYACLFRIYEGDVTKIKGALMECTEKVPP